LNGYISFEGTQNLLTFKEVTLNPTVVGTPQMNSSEQNSYAVDGSHEVMDLKYKLMPTEGTNQTD